MDKEKLIAEIMREAEADGEPVTRKEAEEMAEMEIKAKGVKTYAQADKPRAAAKREVKPDADKILLVDRIYKTLNIYTTSQGGIQNLEIANKQKEVVFTYNGAEYSVTLTKHRPPKK